MKLNVKQKNWLLSLHIASGGLWFGTALCSIALALSFNNLSNGDTLHGIDLARNLMGEFIIVPTAVLSVITGVLLCGLTHWRFFKHSWIIVKQFSTLTLIVIGSVWLGPWTKEMSDISATLQSQARQNLHYVSLNSISITVGVLQTIALLAIIFISTIKPWGKRNTTRELN